ncbi:uncharacterized protein LOC134275315 [Saccostrea cucullata]|uniref:uncharacterized protein LOC134275315 n=1 Tax=Saccostrea cuccullata TaxID=36930 RepID=UPI002ED2BCF9
MESQTKRKPNWNADETLTLTNLVDENKNILRGKLGPTLTSDMKARTWQSIAQTLTAMGVGPARTAAEVEKKWHNIFSKSKSEISDHRRGTTGTGGGPPPKALSAIAEAVSSVVGENNTCLTGIGGGADTTLIQLGLLGEEPLGIHVIEGPSDTVSCFATPPPPPMPSTSTSTSRLVSRTSSTTGSTDLKRKIDELTVRKLELEVEYYALKIKKAKGEE